MRSYVSIVSIAKRVFSRYRNNRILRMLLFIPVSVTSWYFLAAPQFDKVRVVDLEAWPLVDQTTPEVCHTSTKKIAAEEIAWWNDYRISDIGALRTDAPGCERFPQSVGCEYTRETDEKDDISALIRVLEKYSEQLDPDLAALHVRIGDGLCSRIDPSCRGLTDTKPDCWNNDRDCFSNVHSITKQYAYSRRWYETVVLQLKSTQVSKLVIVGDKYHWTRTPDPRKGDHSVDEEYLANIARFFRIHGFEVCVKDKGLPDTDFTLLCSARVFIQGGGGYSALVAQIVKKRGGLVIKPTNSSKYSVNE